MPAAGERLGQGGGGRRPGSALSGGLGSLLGLVAAALLLSTAVPKHLQAEEPPTPLLGGLIEPQGESSGIAIVSAVRKASQNGKPGDVVIEIENHTSLAATGVVLTLAGTDCKHKPGWPLFTYGDPGRPWGHGNEPPLRPGRRASLELPARTYERVAAVSMKTCQRSIAPVLAVDHVLFANGSHWDLGEAVKAKAGAADER